MHIDHPDDPRPAVRQTLAELVRDLERDVPGRVILGALVDCARRLALRLEGVDLDAGSRRRGMR